MKLADGVIHFFHKQSFLIVTTIDDKGRPHASCKGLIDIDKDGKLYLLDLYRERTHDNLEHSKQISVTAVDEHRFRGYCLKGTAQKLRQRGLSPNIVRAWNKRITGRITQRIVKNVQGQKGHSRHPEILLPEPKYIIAVDVKEVVNLTPHMLKE
ncbi:MAG: pyridoxamine 5'-phosphate oxidase family protein [Candidatus Omnitrophica bacterium]|nr:pyridoxamine 5'-phosphate oxidase family protein [Candidatus Omnitrophota bacterium]